MKKIFKRIDNNRFVITESNWSETQRVNGILNAERKELSYFIQYLEYALKSPFATEEDRDLATEGIKTYKEIDAALSKGYLDSGYQYDDLDPRNQMDLYDDNWYDRQAARTGSTIEDEIDSEIRRNVVKRHKEKLHNELYKHFNSNKSEELFGQIESGNNPSDEEEFKKHLPNYPQKPNPQDYGIKDQQYNDYGPDYPYNGMREYEKAIKQWKIDVIRYQNSSEEYARYEELLKNHHALEEMKALSGLSLGEYVNENMHHYIDSQYDADDHGL
jgi:hypothetical protein